MTIDINELREAIQTFGSQAINEDDLKELLDRIEAAEKLIAEWLKANAPGGWIDELRAKAAETKNLREVLKRMCLDEDAAAKEAKALRAQIERIERQKPFAWVCPYDPESETAFSWRPGICKSSGCGHQRVPLYALPGAAPESKP